MYYFLMHGNDMVALCGEDNITKIIFNETFIPFGSKKIEVNKKQHQYNISEWIKNRKIPDNRIGYSKIKSELKLLNVDIEEINENSYSLSLTDKYWIYKTIDKYPIILTKLKLKRYTEIPNYDVISFYNCDFEQGIQECILEHKTPLRKNLFSPENTTCGTSPKYWVKRENKTYLVKQNDVTRDFLVEKEMMTAFIAYVINECRRDNKKGIINVVDYRFEKGDKPENNLCFSENFTDKETSFVSYKEYMHKQDGTEKTFDEIKNELSRIQSLGEYFDFIILLDFLTENNRTYEDMGFLYDDKFRMVNAYAPIFDGSKSFDYMTKDFTRANHTIYSGKHVNVFGMNEEEQCKYLANVGWLMPDMLFRKIDTFFEYLSSPDVNSIPRKYRENIADWIKYKIVLISNERRKKMLAEAEVEEQKYARERSKYNSYSAYGDEEDEV